MASGFVQYGPPQSRPSFLFWWALNSIWMAGRRLRQAFERPSAELVRLRAENERLEKLFADPRADLLSAGPDPEGGFVMKLRSPEWVTQLFAASFMELLNKFDAPNYVEMSYYHRTLGHSKLLLTILRDGGKPPSQLVTEARAETEEVREALRKLLNDADRHAHIYPGQWKDLACEECVGHETTMDFICARHAAKNLAWPPLTLDLTKKETL